MTLNEEKLAELEQAVKAGLGKVDYERKGCFGTLLCKRDASLCDYCSDINECEATMKANEGDLIDEIHDAADEAEVAEVDAKLVEAQKIAEAEAKAKAEAEVTEPVDTAEYVQGGNDKMRVRGAEVDGFEFKIKSKIKVDWNAVVAEVLTSKPFNYKETARIVKGYVHKDYSASAYGWTIKLIAGLVKQGAIEYDSETRIVTWA